MGMSYGYIYSSVYLHNRNHVLQVVTTQRPFPTYHLASDYNNSKSLARRAWLNNGWINVSAEFQHMTDTTIKD